MKNVIYVIALYTFKVKCQYIGINDDYADYRPVYINLCCETKHSLCHDIIVTCCDIFFHDM